MKKLKIYTVIAVVLVIIFVLLGPYFVVQEGELAVVKRFDRIVRTETTAGLKFKIPFIDMVNKFPKKIQSWDGEAQIIPTQENQFIYVDTTARWRISEPKLFYEEVGSIIRAHTLLDDVIDSSVRTIISRNMLREAVRNSNIINEIQRTNVFQTQDQQLEDSSEIIEVISTFTNVKYEAIKKGREELSDEMLQAAKKDTPQGIELIDIIVRQIKYSEDLTQSVYNRMIKERNQIAQAFRSAGEGEKAKWLGKMEKELRSIVSTAERKAKEIKAKADAEALVIRNRAYSKDAEFADFWMALVQYQKLLPQMKKILTTDFEFFKYLYKKRGR
jgi:membrane protease subunit HflC